MKPPLAEFQYDVSQSLKGAARYCKKQFPFIGRAALWMYTLPSFAVVLSALTSESWLIPTLDWTIGKFGISKGLAAAAGIATILVLYGSAFVLAYRIRTRYVYKKLKSVLPAPVVKVELMDDWFSIEQPEAISKFKYSVVYALAKHPEGISVGLDWNSLFIPNSAFVDESSAQTFLKTLLSKMLPDAVARSEVG